MRIPKVTIPGLAVLAASLSASCGGGGTVVPVETSATTPLVYVANPAGGSMFELNVGNVAGTNWTGDYSDSSNEATIGTFSGSIQGGQITLYCENLDATTFTLTGTRQSDGHFRLTRSDQPGTPYDFAPVPQPIAQRSRIPTTFTFALKGFGEGNIKNSGRVFLYGPPTVAGGNTYEGTWQGQNVSVTIINSSTLAVFLYLGSDVVNGTFRIAASQLGSVTKDADNGYANIGNSANYPGIGRPSFSLPPPTISP